MNDEWMCAGRFMTIRSAAFRRALLTTSDSWPLCKFLNTDFILLPLDLIFRLANCSTPFSALILLEEGGGRKEWHFVRESPASEIHRNSPLEAYRRPGQVSFLSPSQQCHSTEEIVSFMQWLTKNWCHRVFILFSRDWSHFIWSLLPEIKVMYVCIYCTWSISSRHSWCVYDLLPQKPEDQARMGSKSVEDTGWIVRRKCVSTVLNKFR